MVSNNKMKEFTKSDLKNRMVVECRNGRKYIVIGDKILSILGYNDLANYNEDLTAKSELSEHDIMKVYDRVLYISFNEGRLDLLWERTDVKEVTMKEVEEKFGCKVKIIKE